MEHRYEVFLKTELDDGSQGGLKLATLSVRERPCGKIHDAMDAEAVPAAARLGASNFLANTFVLHPSGEEQQLATFASKNPFDTVPKTVNAGKVEDCNPPEKPGPMEASTAAGDETADDPNVAKDSDRAELALKIAQALVGGTCMKKMQD